MFRLTTSLSALLLIACSFGSATAAEPHEIWWNYLKGSWTYEISPIGLKGEATWRKAAKGNALVGRLKGDDGMAAIELAGFKDGKEIVTGFGSEGNYWRLEFTERTAQRCEAKNSGRLPDGTSYEGKFVCEKIDDDHWVWVFNGKTGDGENLTMKADLARKAE